MPSPSTAGLGGEVMAVSALRHFAVRIPLILGCWPSVAQSARPHLEFEPKGTFFQLVLVNDSEKAIEAFFVRQTCNASDQFTAAILYNGLRGTSGTIESGEHRGLGGGWKLPSDDLACDAQLEAVFFADGSFEGNDAAVRSLKARGDGITASVNYWMDRIKREKTDGSTLGLLLDAIKQRVAADKVPQGKYPLNPVHGTPPPLREYWEGRREVDVALEARFPTDLSTVKANELLQRVTDYMEKRRADIEGTEALQKLNTVFPPISEHGEVGDKASNGSRR
jgi:hypothetical protein